jgi:hypothetical protein
MPTKRHHAEPANDGTLRTRGAPLRRSRSKRPGATGGGARGAADPTHPTASARRMRPRTAQSAASDVGESCGATNPLVRIGVNGDEDAAHCTALARAPRPVRPAPARLDGAPRRLRVALACDPTARPPGRARFVCVFVCLFARGAHRRRRGGRWSRSLRSCGSGLQRAFWPVTVYCGRGYPSLRVMG